MPIANPAKLMTATPTETDPKRSASAASPTAAERQLMAKREDLKLQRCTAPKRSEECGQKGGQQVPARESKENRQLPVYQSDPILRELPDFTPGTVPRRAAGSAHELVAVEAPEG